MLIRMNSVQTSVQTKTVLLMDDDVILLELFSEILSDYGYQVRTATNGKFALRSIKKSHPDLVIMDMKLPDMSGIEVYASLQSDEDTRSIPVIFMSGVEPTPTEDYASIQGCDYLLKPIDAPRLLSHIRQFFAKSA